MAAKLKRNLPPCPSASKNPEIIKEEKEYKKSHDRSPICFNTRERLIRNFPINLKLLPE